MDTFQWSNSIPQRGQLLSKDLGYIRLEEYVASRYSDSVAQVPREHDGSLDPMKKMFYLNLKWFMNTLLTRKDRMSMACGLEVHVPFADYRLAEYAFNIPSEYKFYAGREKGLLRKALEGYLPDEVLWRKKSPYPKTFNPEYLKRVTSWMQAIMADPNARILQMIDKKQLKALLDSGGQSFGKPWFGQLMNGPQLIAYLIQLALWLERYALKAMV